MHVDTVTEKPVKKSGRPAKYPWREMAVGDTFFAPGRTTNSMHGCGGRYRPMRFRCKQRMINGVFGTRVWRVE